MGISGNGQHRRPRQAPKIVVAFGVTGAGMAIPLLSSGAAHAATASTWDKVANCETGGQWSADRDNGLYGGLDLTQNVWERYGGTDYADSPNLASRQEQIAVAQKILDDRGPGYWTNCAVTAGLARGGPAPDIDPGTSPSGGGSPADPGLLGGLLTGGTPAPSSTASAAPTGTPTAAPSTGLPSSPAPASTPPSPAASSPTSSSVPSAPQSPPSPRSSHAPSSGRHAGSPAAVPDATGSAYTVRPGDNLYEIATDHSLAGGWPALYDANRSTVGGDPDLIHPGQHLRLG